MLAGCAKLIRAVGRVVRIVGKAIEIIVKFSFDGSNAVLIDLRKVE